MGESINRRTNTFFASFKYYSWISIIKEKIMEQYVMKQFEIRDAANREVRQRY